MIATKRIEAFKIAAADAQKSFADAEKMLRSALKMCRDAERKGQRAMKIRMSLDKSKTTFPGLSSMEDSLHRKINTVNDLIDFFREEPEMLKFSTKYI